jgi:hypothetical protein
LFGESFGMSGPFSFSFGVLQAQLISQSVEAANPAVFAANNGGVN